jgi:response regulator RpfG family c-di-GMP phosphodiesterase
VQTKGVSQVVLVDDDEPSLHFYTAVVNHVLGQEALAFEDPRRALKELARLHAQLVIVDYKMPELDGLAFVRALRSLPLHEDTPILMVSADANRGLPLRARESGVTAFLEKPIALDDLVKQLRQLTQRGVRRVTQGEILMPTDERDTILRLHRMLQGFDRLLAEQALHVRDITLAIGEELQLTGSDIEALRFGSLVYDVGMVAVAQKVRCTPGELSSRWRSHVNAHVDAGASILGGSVRPLMSAAEAIARYHHERFDGAGYPDGLRGDEIPHLARIVSVADTFVALGSDRPHRTEFTFTRAVAHVQAERGRAFDPEIVDAFERIKHRFEAIPRSA